MISRFRMSVHDCLEAYRRMGSQVFGYPRPFSITHFSPWHKFEADRLEEVIREIVSQHGEETTPGEIVLFHSSEVLCKTIVAARADIGFQTAPFLFRTYDNPAEGSKTPPINAGPAAMCSIIEVGGATSAAPGYFRPIRIDDWIESEAVSNRPQIEFIDGGFGVNNPSHQVLLDIKRKLRAPSTVFEVFVSFGTGVNTARLQGSLAGSCRLVSEAEKELTDVVRAHEAVENESGLYIEGEKVKKAFKYFRFPGGEDLGDVKMDAWSGRRKARFYLGSRPTGEETLKQMEDAFKQYHTKHVKAKMQALAKLLVCRRRLRTKIESKWERYAYASYYDCKEVGCGTHVELLNLFEDHLRSVHSELSYDDHPLSIEQSRRCWTYRASSEE